MDVKPLPDTRVLNTQGAFTPYLGEGSVLAELTVQRAQPFGREFDKGWVSENPTVRLNFPEGGDPTGMYGGEVQRSIRGSERRSVDRLGVRGSDGGVWVEIRVIMV